MTQTYCWISNQELRNGSFDWIHIYPGGATVPPIFGGSFNHLIWDILKHHPSHLLINRYNTESFEKAKQHDVSIVQVEIGKRRRRVERLKKQIYEITHPGGEWVGPIGQEMLQVASRYIEQTHCTQLLVWGSKKLVRLLRQKFPKHTIAFAHRWYDLPHWTASDFNHADIVLTLSRGVVRQTYERFSRLYPIFLIVPNGVDLEVFHPVSGDKKDRLRTSLGLPLNKTIVLFASSIHGKKGVNYLYQWINRSRQSLPDLHFLLIGQPKGSQRGYKAKLIDCKDRMPNVAWVSGVPRTQMPQYYQLSDISLLPSVWREGMSMVAVESLASGLPIVATQRGIFPEIVQNRKTGILCPPDILFSAGLDALKLLSDNPELRREMGQNARAYAEKRLSRERCLANFDAFFRGDWTSIDYDLSP